MIERERAKKRQIRKPESVPPMLAEQKAESRDIVADKVGMSHGTFDKARAIWEKAKIRAISPGIYNCKFSGRGKGVVNLSAPGRRSV